MGGHRLVFSSGVCPPCPYGNCHTHAHPRRAPRHFGGVPTSQRGVGGYEFQRGAIIRDATMVLIAFRGLLIAVTLLTPR